MRNLGKGGKGEESQFFFVFPCFLLMFLNFFLYDLMMEEPLLRV